jgi:hypothetical protein
MGTSIQTAVSRFASLKLIVPRSKPRLTSAPAVTVREPRAFPEATTPPTLPGTIRDEVLELYAFTFCQGGFRQLDMTFEQFLLVAAAMKPTDLSSYRIKSSTR